MAVRALKRTMENFLAHPFSKAAGMASLSLCMLLLGVTLIVYLSLKGAGPIEPEGPRVTVYLHPQISPQDQEALVQEVKQWPEVAEVLVVSKDEARRHLEGQMWLWKGLLADVPENPRGASLEIIVKPGSKQSTPSGIGEKLGEQSQVEKVLYGKPWAEKLESALSYVEFAGLVLLGLLAFSVVLIISSSIKLAVLSQSDELEIGRIVGATSSFLKLPFYLEGIIQGGVSAALACSLLTVLAEGPGGVIAIPFAGALPLEGGMVSLLVAGLLGTGIALGWMGSYLALRGELPD